MSVLAWILGIALVGVFVFAGATKVADLDRKREHYGYTRGQYRLIGLAELAGAAGVLIGLIWRSFEFVALVAGVGICALMMGALLTHARVDDEGKEAIPAGVVFAVTVVFMIAIALR